MAIPPVVAMRVPIAVPIPRLPRENVFLPVAAQTTVSIPKIIYVRKIFSVPKAALITEVASGISRVPHAWERGISMVRELRETVSLIDRYSGKWAGTGNRCSTLIVGILTRGSRSSRPHSK